MHSSGLNCSWNFPNMSEIGSLVGFNEPMAENFKKTPYASSVLVQLSISHFYENCKTLVFLSYAYMCKSAKIKSIY